MTAAKLYPRLNILQHSLYLHADWSNNDAELASGKMSFGVFVLCWDQTRATRAHLRDVCEQGPVQLVDGVAVKLRGVGDQLDQVGHRLVPHVAPRLVKGE